MSFNVRGSVRDRGTINAWRNRAAPNVATIGRCAPDLIGLQETQWGNLSTYKKMLPGYKRLPGPRYGNIPPYDYNAVLFDPARLEVLDSGGFWLSETPKRYSRSWQTRVARSANWALFRLPDTGLSFLHLNTHLDHVSGPARVQGSALVLRKVAQLRERWGSDLPVIVTLDSNCRPDSPPYLAFMHAGFVDTFLAAGNEDGNEANTYHAFRGQQYREQRPRRKPRRIDWILLNDPQGRMRVASHRIVRDHDKASGIYPSDHYPVLAELATTV